MRPDLRGGVTVRDRSSPALMARRAWWHRAAAMLVPRSAARWWWPGTQA